MESTLTPLTGITQEGLHKQAHARGPQSPQMSQAGRHRPKRGALQSDFLTCSRSAQREVFPTYRKTTVDT